jgi:hypothetical protein
MNREAILARLREHESALKERGAGMPLCSGRARVVMPEPRATPISSSRSIRMHIGIWGYAGLKDYIANLFDGPVDVADRACLKPWVTPSAIAEAMYAF